MTYWTIYRLFIRKLYRTRRRERNSAADALALLLILLNLFSVEFILEAYFGLSGFISLSNSSSFPLVILTPLLVVPILILRVLIKKPDFSVYRSAFMSTSGIKYKTVLSYLIICLITFVLTFILALTN